jgi:hypothetical protein
VESQTEEMFERLSLWQKNSDVGMTKDRYLEMQEQLGREPKIEQCPPGIEDFPEIVVSGINIFNYLGDRLLPDIGYIGKDYTNLPVLLKVYNIHNIEEIELILDILSRLDSHAIEKSHERMKRERDKMKRKTGGR